jgi:glycosyltransferase involved in cell wall biosynthesis
MQPLRILMIASRYFPHHGGLEMVVRELSSQLRQQGHTVAIVTNRYPNRLPKHETIDDIAITRLRFLYPRLGYLQAGRLDLWLAGFVYFPLTFLELFVIVLRFKPDAVNLHYLGSPSLHVWLLQRWLGVRLVVSLHGGDVDGEPYHSRFNRWLFLAVLSRAAAVTACSRTLMSQAVTIAPEAAPKMHVVYNGVHASLFSQGSPYPHPRPYIVAVGQLELHKGFDVLLAAFAQVAAAAPPVDLLIAGHGSTRAQLEAQTREAGVNERVHFLGAVTHEQVASLMRSALAVVIPSRRESFGLVGIEALASGRAVIVSRIGGLVETIDGADVIWTAPGDSADVARALRQVLENPEDMNTIKSENQRRAAEYSWERVAGQYMALYRPASGDFAMSSRPSASASPHA